MRAKEQTGVTMLRDLGGADRFPYLGGLGIARDDLGRLDVAATAVSEGGIYVNAVSGDSRLLAAGDAAPDGVWIAQRDIDELVPRRVEATEPHGFGEGWGTQAEQVGGDRSYPEEDSGGGRRVAHGNAAADADAGDGSLPPG